MTPLPCSCSSSGPAASRPASIPTRWSWDRRRDRAATRRATAGDRTRRSAPADTGRHRGRRRTGPPIPPAVVGISHVSRHGSLSATVSWSFGLLDAALQRTFTDLSVFAGSFTALDAAAICGVDVGLATSALDQLVERSLVMRAPGRRYVLLETLRAFGAEQLSADGRARARLSVTPATTSSGPRPPIVGSSTPRAAPSPRSSRPPGTALGSRLAARPRAHRAGRPSGQRPSRLRDHAPATRRPRLGGAGVGRRSRRSQPIGAGGVGDQRIRRVDGRRPRRGRDPCHPGPGRGIAGGRRVAVGGVHVEREHGVVRGTSRRCRPLVQAGSRGGSKRSRAMASRLGHASPRPRLRRRSRRISTCRRVDGRGRRRVDPGRRLRLVLCWRGRAVSRLRSERAPASPTRSSWPRLTNASFVAGLAGASRASIDARLGDPFAAAADYRRLITHWRRAGMWSTQWTMLRSIAGLLSRLDRPRESAVLVGAVRATQAGHRIFGEDEARLDRARRAVACRARRR